MHTHTYTHAAGGSAPPSSQHGALGPHAHACEVPAGSLLYPNSQPLCVCVYTGSVRHSLVMPPSVTLITLRALTALMDCWLTCSQVWTAAARFAVAPVQATCLPPQMRPTKLAAVAVAAASHPSRPNMLASVCVRPCPNRPPLTPLAPLTTAAEISTSKERSFAAVDFVDTPGLVDGDMKVGSV